VFGTATGPALGGALTQAFDWRAIFLAQAPVALAAALAAAGVRPSAPAPETPEHAPLRSALAPGAALALVSAALTAVLFLLVLLLVAGWDEDPLRAAAAVTVLPLAALAGARIGGDTGTRAAVGCALVSAGVLPLAFLPDARLVWTFLPQALAGLGMGLALPALAGGLLPERSALDAARLLAVRHAGIAIALAVLAPVLSHDLDRATERARLRGVALVLDARLDPSRKIALAPDLLAGVRARRPRSGLREAVARHRADVSSDERPAYDRLGRRADETLVAAVGEGFRSAFLISGLLALLAAGLLAGRARRRLAVVLASAAAVAMATGMALAHRDRAPAPVPLTDPCAGRSLPDSGGLEGILQQGALTALDAAACKLGSTREELVLALADADERERFRHRYGVDPASIGGIAQLIFG
jgi:hypothetical protein